MATNSNIEWTHHTFNPWRGCTKVSPGCANCYAETMSGRNPGTLGVWGPQGTRVVASEAMWREPLKWNKAAEKAGERHRVFCASLADVFEDWTGPMVNAAGIRLSSMSDEWLAHGLSLQKAADLRRLANRVNANAGLAVETPPHEHWLTMDDVRSRLFRLIDDTPNLDWLLLTKRPENIARMTDAVSSRPFIVHDPEAGPRQERWTTWKEIGVGFDKLFPNVWLGVSVEDQQRADARIPLLLQTPAAVRFLSCEPLLGYVDLRQAGCPACKAGICSKARKHAFPDWVIIGGESGPARPCNIAWVRSIVEQCRAAGVAAFVKQLGSHPIEAHPEDPQMRLVQRRVAGIRDKKGGNPEEWPADLRVREFPTTASPATQPA